MRVLTRMIWQIVQLVMESDELEIYDFYNGKKIIFLVTTYYIVLCKYMNIYYACLCHFENISKSPNNEKQWMHFFRILYECF